MKKVTYIFSILVVAAIVLYVLNKTKAKKAMVRYFDALDNEFFIPKIGKSTNWTEKFYLSSAENREKNYKEAQKVGWFKFNRLTKDVIEKGVDIDFSKGSEHDIMIERFRLRGKIPRTLEEVGEMFELTRERIKQIEQKVLKKLSYNYELKQIGKTLS